MSRRFLTLALALALALTCVSCGKGEPSSAYRLYFPVSANVRHGPALDSEGYRGTDTPTPDVLLTALLSGPTGGEFLNPFPRGVTVQRCKEDTDRAGHWKIILSEQYSGLTDVSLTLADYCIVLTLTQLEGVDSVELASAGYSANYRSHQVLTPDEALLDDTLPAPEDVPS